MMEYNSQREMLIVKEFGRNIQKMVRHAADIGDKDERNKAVETIAKIMSQIHPQAKDNEEEMIKIWDYIHRIAGYKLDVDSPFPPPLKDVDEQKPEKLNYPSKKMRFKHYGKTTENLIKYARTLEDGEERNELVQMIANLMKKCYLNFNRDSVNDQLIFDHLNEMSEGELILSKDFTLDLTTDILSRNAVPAKKKKRHTKSNHRQKKRY